MVIEDTGIKELNLITKGYRKENLQPASYDLTLDRGAVSLSYPNEKKKDNFLVLRPRSSYLLSSVERIELPDNIAGTIKDKSSFSRSGLRINQGWVDPGFKGNLTVLMTNTTNKTIKIRCGESFCQIVFLELARPAKQAYNGRYQDQEGVKRI